MVTLKGQQQRHYLPCWHQSGSAFRTLFRKMLVQLDLSELQFQPYSLRRGGATFEMQSHRLMEKTLLRGRWWNSGVARIYLCDGLSVLPSLKMSLEAKHLVARFSSIFFFPPLFWRWEAWNKVETATALKKFWCLDPAMDLWLEQAGVAPCLVSCHGHCNSMSSAMSLGEALPWASCMEVLWHFFHCLVPWHEPFAMVARPWQQNGTPAWAQRSRFDCLGECQCNGDACVGSCLAPNPSHPLQGSGNSDSFEEVLVSWSCHGSLVGTGWCCTAPSPTITVWALPWAWVRLYHEPVAWKCCGTCFIVWFHGINFLPWLQDHSAWQQNGTPAWAQQKNPLLGMQMKLSKLAIPKKANSPKDTSSWCLVAFWLKNVIPLNLCCNPTWLDPSKSLTSFALRHQPSWGKVLLWMRPNLVVVVFCATICISQNNSTTVKAAFAHTHSSGQWSL